MTRPSCMVTPHWAILEEHLSSFPNYKMRDSSSVFTLITRPCSRYAVNQAGYKRDENSNYPQDHIYLQHIKSIVYTKSPLLALLLIPCHGACLIQFISWISSCFDMDNYFPFEFFNVKMQMLVYCNVIGVIFYLYIGYIVCYL